MKLRKAATLFTLGTLHILVFLPKIFCSGVFELRLTSFMNDRGMDSNGNCCNGVNDASNVNSVGPVCTEPCHTFLTICLTNYMNDIPADLIKEKCVFGYVMTSYLGGNNVNFENLSGFNNVIGFHFNISWPGTFSIIIEAWHDATLTNPVTGSPRKLISSYAAQREIQVSSEWLSFMHKTDTTQLEYKYRVQCDKDYYDSGCSTLCRPRDDHFGHYTCAADGSIVCTSGWQGNYCDQAICLAGCEKDHGFCDNPNECKCRLGWEGPLCRECIKCPGCKNGTCILPWQCNCDDGWGGLFCNQDLNYCTHYSPCENGGLCQNTGSGSYTCICQEGYTGTNCEREIDDCQSRPCLNGGSCEDIGTGYRCRCPIKFTGTKCDVVAENCEKNPCKNGATCVEGQGSYACICKTGYTGRNCDMEIYECDPNPCQNAGRCIDEVNGFKCVCESGFTGLYCETNIDDCSQNPCHNSGTCIDKLNDFQCRCVPGFVGELCETNIDDCAMRPCANGAACKDLMNDFECTCRPGFTGRFCTIDIDECASNPCKNGASCSQGVDFYNCACPSDFTGKNCQYLPGQVGNVTRDAITQTTTSTSSRSELNGEHNATIIEKQSIGQVQDSEEFTVKQLLLIVCLGVGVPLLSIIIVVTILLCRKRRTPDRTSKEKEENVQNMKNSIKNKLQEAKIFTTFPHSGSTFSNSTYKISNEDTDCNTLKSNNTERRPVSQIYIGGEKLINNKQLLYSKDLKVHAKHRDFVTTTKSLEKSKSSIDSSNLDVGDYYNSPDIHIIDRHITHRDAFNRNSLFIREPRLHQDPHRHNSYYGDDVLATEV